MSLGHSLTGFTLVFHQGIEMEQARHDARVAWQEHGGTSAQAMNQAQTVELDLLSDELAVLLEIFEEDSTANAYLQIKSDDLRRAWVRHKLAGASVTPTV